MAGLYEDEILGAQQQRDLARKLRDTEVPSTGHMIGDWYVAPTVAQQLSAVLKQGIGAYKENQAEDEIKGLKQERARSSADAFSQMGMQAPSGLLAEAGTPAIKPSIMDRLKAFVTPGESQPKGTPAQPYQQTLTQNPNETQTMGGILNLAGSNPEMAAVAQAMQGQKWTRENAAALAKQALIEKNAAREDTQAFQAQQNELARLQAKTLHDDTLANRPQPQAPQGSIVEVIDPNDPTRMIKMNTLTREVYGTSGSIPKVAAVAPEVSDANAAKDTVNYLRTKYVVKGVDTVENLIKGSTSGGMQQSAADAYEYLTGEGTSGAENIAQLKTVANDITLSTLKGKLGAGISNADRDFLQAKLGDIGNPKLASNVRLAAWQEYKNGVAAIANGGRADMPQGQAPEATQPQAPAPADTGGFSIRAIP
jgi:hypothetical protein